MNPEPLQDAVEKISAKTPVGSVLKSADWAKVPLALRERAQFSSGVESARLLQAIQDRIAGQIQQQREQLGDGQEATFDRSSFIDAIREIARDEGLTPADPDKRGTIEDITSIRRLGLIYDTQIAQAQGYARWKLDQSEGALLLWPAQEFLRVEQRKDPREDWPKRFAEAARDAGDEAALAVQRDTGRMIALKNSPLWSRLSRFGTPWPPFDFGSGMGLEDIDRDEAVALGLIGPNEIIEGAEKDFNEGLQASVKDLSPDLIAKLKEQFGDKVKVEKGSIWWKGDRKGKALVKPKPAAVPDLEIEPTPTPAPASQFPTTLEGLQTVRGLGGSTGATLVRDPKTGRQFVLKRGNSPAHVREEFAADQLYRALGVAVPDARLFEEGGSPAKLAEFIPGKTLAQFLEEADAGQKAATLAKLQQHFAADALLGNWDVAGLSLDNILVDGEGTPWRIDNGGSLRFRAQGAAKTAAEWNEFPTELWTLRDAALNKQTAQVFDGLNIYDIARQIDALKPEALDSAPEEVKTMLASRLEQLKSIGRKALDYEATQFVPGHADKVTEQMMGLRKDRLVERLPAALRQHSPGDVTVVDSQGKPFDDLRTHGSHSDPSQTYYDAILPAVKTINGHHDKGDTQYNQAKLTTALSHKPALTELMKSGTEVQKTMASHYLSYLKEIENAKGDKSTKVGKLKKYELEETGTGSTISALAGYMEKNGGNWQIIADWASAQGGSSNSQESRALKRFLMERLAGASAEDFHSAPTPEALAASRKQWGAQYDRSFEIFHAFIQETLARTDFEGNDRRERALRVLRTESTTTAVPFKKGDKGDYKRGVNESGSVFKPVFSGMRTITAVPHTRVTGIYFFERQPGSGTTFFYGDSENEVTYIGYGLKTYNAGKNGTVNLSPGRDRWSWEI